MRVAQRHRRLGLERVLEGTNKGWRRRLFVLLLLLLRRRRRRSFSCFSVTRRHRRVSGWQCRMRLRRRWLRGGRRRDGGGGGGWGGNRGRGNYGGLLFLGCGRLCDAWPLSGGNKRAQCGSVDAALPMSVSGTLGRRLLLLLLLVLVALCTLLAFARPLLLHLLLFFLPHTLALTVLLLQLVSAIRMHA